MYLWLILTIAFWGQSNVLTVDVPSLEYRITDNKLLTKNGQYLNTPGVPKLPCRKLTIALPPGTVLESVQFYGTRNELETLEIAPTEPMLPLIDKKDIISRTWGMCKNRKDKIYSSDLFYPETYGKVVSRGGLRKYTLIDVVCYPFAYKPVSKRLYYTPFIRIEVHYRMIEPESKRAKIWQRLMDDVTFDEIAKEVIYNWEDAQTWYQTDKPKQANGYTIIIPSSLESSVDNLVTWRQSLGYNVNIVTKEYIESNVAGNDLEQKIRNYLRENMVDIEYVLLVGFVTDMPMRQIVPFNNDPDSPYDDPIFSPIPSDLYYAELTDPDSLSWNSDRDEYYGEVFNQNFELYGDDNPDYYADVHLGRIPFSTKSIIEDICEKTITFDSNTDLVYKTAALLAGGVYYFENENHGGNPRNDGADYMEQLMNDSVIDRSVAVYLYDKTGLSPCSYSCTDSLTRNNMISYCQNKGIMYECHHGTHDKYARRIWAWDDGDSIPESNEIQCPTCLHQSDVYQLDNDYPATTFLRSCLCGKSEITGLGAQLLHHGSSVVISSSRVTWMSSLDPGGMPYHFFDRLMKDTTLSNGIIGKAYDLARNDFMDATGSWLPAYHYNLFGDPALKQLGRYIGIEEVQTEPTFSPISIYPNPFIHTTAIRYSLNENRNDLLLTIYDLSGRLIETIESNTIGKNLKSGIYFLKIEGYKPVKLVKLK